MALYRRARVLYLYPVLESKALSDKIWDYFVHTVKLRLSATVTLDLGCVTQDISSGAMRSHSTSTPAVLRIELSFF
jgi:hypothetical protein